MVSAGQNYVFFGTGAFSYKIKYGVSAMFKICLDIFAFFSRRRVPALGGRRPFPISNGLPSDRKRFTLLPMFFISI